MASIVLERVTKSWDKANVLQPLDLEIADGEFVAILGPSGCGKSTTLFLLAGLYAPTSGRILFDGAEVNAVDARDRNVGIVFQSYALYPHLTVRQNIAFPLRFKKTARAEAGRRVEDAARLVEVHELLDRKPAELSGGQQQRVALARALVKEPNILLLDEPLSNLDATLRMSMRAELRAIQRRLGMTTLLVTHDQLEATTMADRVICMNKGEIAQIATPDELYRKPADRFVASFIGAPPITLLEGHAAGRQLRIATATLALSEAASGPMTLGLRPEDVRLVEVGAGHFPARVELVEPMGRETLYRLSTPLGAVTALEPGETARLAPGDRLDMHLPGDLAVLFDHAGKRLDGLTLGTP